jgi:hypothetical protein
MIGVLHVARKFSLAALPIQGDVHEISLDLPGLAGLHLKRPPAPSVPASAPSRTF